MGTHTLTWQHLQWGAQSGYPTPGAATPTGIQDKDAPRKSGIQTHPTSPSKPPNANGKAASAFLFTTLALAEKLPSPAILSHPANFSKHPPITLHKYIHLVNIPLTRSAYSVHNLLWSSTKSVTEAITRFQSRQLTLIFIWGWGCTCQCSFTGLIHFQVLYSICFTLTYTALVSFDL